MPDEITITIDGREIKTTPDKMVVQAANDAGLYIPYLCYHPGMKPYGACRMCVVEVEGQRGTPASCTLPVRDGMVVNTKHEDAEKVRNTTLDLLLSEHPHGCLTCHRIDLCGPQDICLRHVDVVDRCVTCPKNERCELKDTTRFHPQGMVSPLTYQYRTLQVETKDPFYDRDYNLCIVCARCTRSCDELRGDVAIGMTERAGQVLVGTVMGESLLESGCEFCGACIDVCPVGALTETQYKWERPSRVEQSICGECPGGCTMTYEVNNWEKIVRAVPELNSPANLGQSCFKGKFGFDYANDKRRIKTPMIRLNDELVETTWEEAIQFVAKGIAPFKGDSFALMASPRSTNEELFAAQKFTRTAMNTNNIDVASNNSPGIVEGFQDVFGYFAGTMNIWDLLTSKVVMVVSANLTEEQNLLAIPIKRAVRAGTQKLIVVDSREVELTRYANLWLRPYPGTDPVLLGGILRSIIDNGLADLDFINAHADGWDDLVGSLSQFSLDAVSQETGVEIDKIEDAARMFAESGLSAVLLGGDNSVGGTRRTTSRITAAITLATANIGKKGAGFIPLYHGANEQGAWDVGAWSNSLPGHNLVQNEIARDALSTFWDSPIPLSQGSGNRSMFDGAIAGDVKAMILLGNHVHLRDGGLGDVTSALKKLDFLVVAEAFESSITEFANVVLPAEVWAEKTGTYTNIERRIQPLKKIVKNKKSDSRSYLSIICSIAEELGVSGFQYANADEVLEEIAQLIPEYKGVSYSRLLSEMIKYPQIPSNEPQPTQVMYSGNVLTGLQWPCIAENTTGTDVLYSNAEFRYGKAKLFPAVWHAKPQKHPDYPMMLAHGRVLIQPSQMPQVIVGPKGNNMIERQEHFQINPLDGISLNLEDGQSTMIEAIDGSLKQGIITYEKSIPEGVISLTTLFGELAVEVDSSDNPDAVNDIKRLNATPSKIYATDGAVDDSRK
tara:strand:- start:20188 stop:23049 length:2862 start_codon:yes stop_codon:yes gene_type:complete